MTKLVTSVSMSQKWGLNRRQVSALQLVERGLMALDDATDIEKYLPELGQLKVLKGYDGEEPVFEEQEAKITLRMLLTHTAGT